MEPTDYEQTLREVLRGESTIAAAWLFGSAARDALRDESDLDVAVLLSDVRATAASEHRALASLAARLEARTGRAIDLVVLGVHDPIIAHRVLSEGRLLVEHDRPRRVTFMADALSRYLDWAPLYETAAARSLAVNRAWARGAR